MSSSSPRKNTDSFTVMQPIPMRFSDSERKKMMEKVISERNKMKKEAARDAGFWFRTSEKSTSSLPASLTSIEALHQFIVEFVEKSPATKVDEALEKLESVVLYEGTLHAMDSTTEALKQDEVSVKDFVPAGLAYLMKKPAEPEIVRNFLLKTLHLQGLENKIDNFTLGEGVLPGSFEVSSDFPGDKETIIADFDGSAIGRVPPIDSGLWWIILLRAYTKCTNDHTLQERLDVQKGIRKILKLCLSDDFTFPTFLCADCCSMIDRRMSIYGFQTLFYFALRCAMPLLKPFEDEPLAASGFDPKNTRWSYHNGGSWPSCLMLKSPLAAKGAACPAASYIPNLTMLSDNDSTQSSQGGKQDEEGNPYEPSRPQDKLVMDLSFVVVYWYDRLGTMRLLGRVEDVHLMSDARQFLTQIYTVCYQHNLFYQHENDEIVYYRLWTNGIQQISITDVPWFHFRQAVRGAILVEGS